MGCFEALIRIVLILKQIHRCSRFVDSVYLESDLLEGNPDRAFLVGISFQAVCIAFRQPENKAHSVLQSINLCRWPSPNTLTANGATGGTLDAKVSVKTCTGVFTFENHGNRHLCFKRTSICRVAFANGAEHRLFERCE